jgi:hypothetical protein
MPLAIPIGLFDDSVGVKTAALAGLPPVAPMEAQIIATAAAAKIPASTYRDRRSSHPARRYARVEPTSPTIHTIKPLASGAATRWQGYVALLGLGMTLTKNHISASKLVMGRSNAGQHRCGSA